MNTVSLVGRMATTPVMKYTPTGVAVATFRLAVDRDRKNAEGVREVDFFPVVVWRQSAEFAVNYLPKGRLVSVVGRLQNRSWVAQDGTKRYITEVVAQDIRALGSRPKTEGEDGEPVEAPIETGPETEETPTE